jgi:hypothetical protein
MMESDERRRTGGRRGSWPQVSRANDKKQSQRSSPDWTLPLILHSYVVHGRVAEYVTQRRVVLAVYVRLVMVASGSSKLHQSAGAQCGHGQRLNALQARIEIKLRMSSIRKSLRGHLLVRPKKSYAVLDRIAFTGPHENLGTAGCSSSSSNLMRQ